MYKIYVGSEEAMRIYATRKSGVTGLNTNTMRWHTICKNAKYEVRIDKTIKDEYSPTGFSNMATLLCDKDLRKIAEEKGLLMP